MAKYWSVLFASVVLCLHVSNAFTSEQQKGLLTSNIVDDCCCSVDNLLAANKGEINPLLNQIVSKRFFQYFKLDLYSDCPFWVSDAVCGLGGCAVCECDEDELPNIWKQTVTDFVDVNVPQNFVSWSDSADDMWTVRGNEEDLHYVNLVKYPEANTGYRDGSIVWNRIYNENCFKGPLDSLCLEQRVFFRLISGLHTSINVHVSHNFEKELNEWKPDLNYYYRSVAQFPDRIKNLYFTFLFVLRAVDKAAPFLREYPYFTGNTQEAAEIRDAIKELLNVDLLCQPNFDESALFSDPEKEQLRLQLKQHFRNISLIMNCVSCEKCKVWAKLQTLGLGTALKILLEPDTENVINHLQRNEIIALINTLRQLSNSVEFVQHLDSLLQITNFNPDTTTTDFVEKEKFNLLS